MTYFELRMTGKNGANEGRFYCVHVSALLEIASKLLHFLWVISKFLLLMTPMDLRARFARYERVFNHVFKIRLLRL
jgi:hypothetical protein